jgi:predicted AlkP superfamily phosphohydrolase/phosphomutase
MSTPRLLIIGIDGATFDLVEPWAEAGYLPTLSRLMKEGTHGPLLAWPNMNSAAAWTSMVTGYNPGQHGIYGFGRAVLRGKQAWRPTTGASRRKEAFWTRLSAAGDRVGVVNVPISFPADPVNGFMLAGMDTPSVYSRGFSHPPDLADDLRRQGIDYLLDVPNLGVLSKRDPSRGARLAREMVDVRAETIRYLMMSRPWDMLMAVFVVTDRLQHHYWPQEDTPLDAPEWAPIRDIYSRIDAEIAELIDRVDGP